MRCRIPTSASVEAARSKTEADPNQLLIRATIASRPSYSSSPWGSRNRAWASLAREATSLSKSRAASSPRNLCDVAPSASAVGTRLCSIISITSRSPLGGIVRPTPQIVKRSIEYLTGMSEVGILRAMTERAVKVELFDQFARVAQAAASGRRVEIVDVLANGERSVEELSRQVAMSVANTSRHLQVLKEAGLVAATRDGTRVRYRLGSPAVYRFWVALRSLAAERLPGMQRLVDAYLGSREGLEAITGDQLLARLRAGEPLVVGDVRPAEEYQAAHVAGAVSIPLAELEQRLRELPREREVVAYCRGPYCAFAPEAARTLRKHGYSARYLSDGLPQARRFWASIVPTACFA